jgi:hypothetical protein
VAVLRDDDAPGQPANAETEADGSATRPPGPS